MASEPIDVGIVTSHMSFEQHGGSNYSRHRLGQELEARGHRATIYTLNFMDENHIPVPHDYELVESRVDARSIVDGGVKFLRMVGDYFDRHDIIHVYVPGIIPFFGWHKRRTGDETPVVAHLNGYTPFCTATDMMADGCWKSCTLSKKLRHARQGAAGTFTPGSIARAVFNQAATVRMMNELDGYFCLSPSVRRIYADIGVDESLLDVVPNMVDPEFATDAGDPDHAEPPNTTPGSGQWRDPGEPVRLLYVGRVDAMKSIDVLLDGLANLNTAQPWRCDIVGDNVLGYGQGLDAFRRDADRLGLGDRVTFHGWVDYTELSPYYADADLFIHAAGWPEPFGRTIIEALDHGLPIVCSRTGAPPWIAGSAGISHPPDDSAALSETVGELIDNPWRRQAMAANAGVELRRFDPEYVMSDIVGAYRDLLGRATREEPQPTAIATDGGDL